MDTLLAPISAGELIDKITILEIKQKQIRDPDKLIHIEQELAQLTASWQRSQYAQFEVSDLRIALSSINQRLWDIEDRIREKELLQEFDDEFIELARSVYFNNDERARLKKDINLQTGSILTEEKSYQEYRK